MRPFRTLRLLLIVNFILVYLAMRSYGEHFQFWVFPLSSLGGSVTMNGFPNAASQRIFDADMFFSSLLMLVHGFQFRSFETYPMNRLVSGFSFTASAGFVFAMSPHNLPVWATLHACGAASFVVSLCLVGLIHLGSLRGDYREWYHRILWFFLVIPLVIYGVLFIVQNPLNDDAQKPAVIFIGIVLLITEFDVQRKYGQAIMNAGLADIEDATRARSLTR